MTEFLFFFTYYIFLLLKIFHYVIFGLKKPPKIRVKFINFPGYEDFSKPL